MQPSPHPPLVQIMAPFPVFCLGWFCLGYNLAPAPGRQQAIRELLMRADIVTPEVATLSNVATVLARLLTQVPMWIALTPSVDPTVIPLVPPHLPAPPVVARCVSQWVPYCAAGVCTCGEALRRWKSADAHFFTLSAGLVVGQVVFLRCFACKAVYGGHWRWDDVPEDSQFPAGFHRPRCVHTPRSSGRWFFATPQIVWEEALLTFLLGCLARGGMSHTAVFCVCNLLWSATLADTMYANRTHFVSKLCVALLSWASLRLRRQVRHVCLVLEAPS